MATQTEQHQQQQQKNTRFIMKSNITTLTVFLGKRKHVRYTTGEINSTRGCHENRDHVITSWVRRTCKWRRGGRQRRHKMAMKQQATSKTSTQIYHFKNKNSNQLKDSKNDMTNEVKSGHFCYIKIIFSSDNIHWRFPIKLLRSFCLSMNLDYPSFWQLIPIAA